MANTRGKSSRKRTKKNKKNNNNRVIIVSIILVAFTLVLVLVLRNINDMKMRYYEGLGDRGDYPASELNPQSFFTDEYGFKGYDDEKFTYKRGIDVSEHQARIDWAKVKDAGVEFAFIRVGYRTADTGSIYKDTYFEDNIKGAQDNGIEVGIYFFSQATTVDEAIDEAKFAADHLKGYSIDLPVAFDFEEVNGDTDRIADMTKEAITECADAFCSVIENHGYNSIIYANPSQTFTKYNLSQLAHRKLWLAHYINQTWYDYKFDVWQYSKSGRVDGIDWPVDLDIMIVEK